MYLTVFLGGEYGNADVTELYNSKKRKWKIVNRKNGFAKLNGFSAVGFDQNAYVFGGWDINELEVRNGLLEGHEGRMSREPDCSENPIKQKSSKNES